MNKERGRKFLNSLWRIALILLIVFVFFGIKYKLLFNSGCSMSPAIQDREMIIMERCGQPCMPNRMDVIVIKSVDDGCTLVKRIIGMPDERIEVKEGIIYINGRKIEDPYTVETPQFGVELTRIPDDCYFVIGDNRESSLFGIFHRREIWGIVIF